MSKSFTKKDRFDMNIGLETLSIMALAGYQLDKLNQVKKKGLYSILNIQELFHKSNLRDFECVLRLKIELLGKDYIEYCCILAIAVYEKCDIDVIASLNNPDKGHIKSSRKSKALKFQL